MPGSFLSSEPSQMVYYDIYIPPCFSGQFSKVVQLKQM